MAKDIQLGSIVKDRITGFTGVATGRHQYLTGCNKIDVTPQALDKDGQPVKAAWFDEQMIDVVAPPIAGLVDEVIAGPGGPSDMPRRSL